MNQQASVWRYFDVWLATAVIVLTAYGVLIIRSAITNTPAFVGYEVRQMQWMALGLIAMITMASIDYRILTSSHWYIYVGFLAALGVVLAIGAVNNQVNRWIPVGSNFLLQPSEFGRIFIAVTLGAFMANRQHNVHKLSNTFLSILYMGVPIGLIFIQPDLGMSILFIVMWFGIVMIAGLPRWHFFLLLVIGAGALYFAFPQLEQYQQDRITVFLDPESDVEQFRNVENALISIGSGGWFGKGYFNGSQSQLGFLRVQHTDFIFAVVVEEMGFFFGSLIVLGLMSFILLRILRVASISPDPAGRYICVGIAIILFFQTVVSVGMNLALLPVTGLTLPFVSYGGSALLSLYIGIGIVQSVLMRHRKQDFG